jgi:hypothetical protein
MTNTFSSYTQHATHIWVGSVRRQQSAAQSALRRCRTGGKGRKFQEIASLHVLAWQSIFGFMPAVQRSLLWFFFNENHTE